MTQDSASPQGQLVSARQITPSLHSALLDALRRALVLLQEKGPTEAGVRELRVRDWWIVTDEGELCVEIFLDKGFVENANAFGGLEARTQLTLEECAEFHASLLETDILDVFGDALQIRVGSPGGEPFLREAADFRAATGLMVEVATWTKHQNRDKFVMLLKEVSESSFVLAEGPHTFPFLYNDVRVARALPFHPLSAKPSRKGKAKAKAGNGK